MSEAIQPGPLADSVISALEYFLIQIAIEFVLYGIYSALAIIVLHKLLTNKAPLVARHILIAAAISMFVASTIQISLDLAAYLIQLPTLGFDPPNVEIPLINMKIFNDTMYLIGDSIVVWRAWVLWTNHPRVHMLLCICLIATFVGVTVDLALEILFRLSQFSESPRFSPTGSRTLILTLPLFFTNFISTVLIAFKVWEYKVEIKRNLSLSHNKRTKVEQVLIFLAESGSIYCLLWAIYPIIIVLLLALEKDNLESTVNGQSFLQSLRFASRPQVPTVTQSDDVTPDSTTSHIDSVMPDPDTDDRPILPWMIGWIPLWIIGQIQKPMILQWQNHLKKRWKNTALVTLVNMVFFCS
ncbi:hypothetical protein C8J56DRAFT_1131837 [Mycena floridula]|nr:hypothetical protein C8J56DRAFT_1131837 [Mycena floridula]